jgi:hypothetical protein
LASSLYEARIAAFTCSFCSSGSRSTTLRICRVGRWRGGHRNGDFR